MNHNTNKIENIAIYNMIRNFLYLLFTNLYDIKLFRYKGV